MISVQPLEAYILSPAKFYHFRILEHCWIYKIPIPPVSTLISEVGFRGGVVPRRLEKEKRLGCACTYVYVAAQPGDRRPCSHFQRGAWSAIRHTHSDSNTVPHNMPKRTYNMYIYINIPVLKAPIKIVKP